MKNNHSPSISGPENGGNTHPGFGLFFPGWSKTRTRTRNGKAPAMIPGFSQSLSGSGDDTSSAVMARPRKALACAAVFDKALSGSDDECREFSGPENGERVVKNLPPKKRKLESADSGPLMIHARGDFSHSGLIDDGIPNPRPEISKKGKDSTHSDNVAYRNPARAQVQARKHHGCDICGRDFKSYQALGGHKSHHNYVGSESVHPERPEGRFSGHKCPFCDRMFSKGQALGGHKRHCRRTVHCIGVQDTTNGPMGFSFDLNEFPPGCVSEDAGTVVAHE